MALSKQFPPSLSEIGNGVLAYRRRFALGEQKGKIPFPIREYEQRLKGKEFVAGDGRWKVVNVKISGIAPSMYDPGSLEVDTGFLLASIAPAVASRSYLGTGQKDPADAAATKAQRTALNSMSISATVCAGEGSGRDEQGEDGAPILKETMGKGGKVVSLGLDPLEVTNQCKVLKRDGGDFKGGTGWDRELAPNNWYPGYSGASTLLFVLEGAPTAYLSDELYADKLQVSRGVQDISMGASPAMVVNALTTFHNISPADLIPGTLARTRHVGLIEQWGRAGMLKEKGQFPSDGDAMFAPALAAQYLHLGAGAGGITEALFAALLGEAFGVETYLQIISSIALREAKTGADLLNEKQRFGWRDAEIAQMIDTRFFDGQQFPLFTQHSSFPTDLLRGDVTANLLAAGWRDVRTTTQRTQLFPTSSYLCLATGVTDSKWAEPLHGIRQEGNSLVTRTLMACGQSQMIAVVTTTIQEV